MSDILSLANVGLGAASSVVDSGLGLLTQELSSGIQDKWSQKAEKRAWERQLALYDKMYRDNSPENRVKQLEDAGLSVGLMYGSGGMGGGGSASGTTAGQGQAGGQMVHTNTIANILGLENTKSQIELNKSQAAKNYADAGLSGAKQTTEDEQRRSLVEKLTQEGIGKYMENVIQNWKISGDMNENTLSYSGSGFGIHAVINKEAFIGQDAINLILEGQAKIGNIRAQEALTNEKVKGYVTELANATMHAEADNVKSIAMKMAAEFQYGEQANWKWWAEFGKEITKTVGGIATGLSPKKVLKGFIQQ